MGWPRPEKRAVKFVEDFISLLGLDVEIHLLSEEFGNGQEGVLLPPHAALVATQKPAIAAAQDRFFVPGHPLPLKTGSRPARQLL